MAASPILAVEQKLIEATAKLSEHRFYRRLTLIWMLAGNLLIAGAITGVNILIHWPKPDTKDSQGFTDFLLGIGFIASSLGSVYWWNKNRVAINATQVQVRQLEAERRSHQAEEGESRAIPGFFHGYLESIPKYRDEYRRSAEKYRSRHNLFQLTVIVGSILTSVFTTASAQQSAWSWPAIAVSALVSVSAGIISYFKFRERSLNLQQTADAIDLELQTYNLRIRRYKLLPADEASAQFAEEVERIREEQRKKELQLEQPPEASQQSTNSSGNSFQV